MSAILPDGPTPPLSLDQLIDRICTPFETALKKADSQERKPHVEDYLKEIPASERQAILRELILLEVHYRRRWGEVPQASEYRARFPELNLAWLAEVLTSTGASVSSAGAVAGNTLIDRPPTAGAGNAGATFAVGSERYTRTRLHAQGGIGQVWLAHDATLGRDVALKELRPDRAHQPEARTRFLTEARITGQLEHPSIVPVYELARDTRDQQPFYAMRFVRGRTLAEAVRAFHGQRQAGRAGTLELIALLNAFVAVCQAVAYAHSRGVLHRDLKGQNVVLGDFGEVILLDWGLAKARGAESGGPDPKPDQPNLGQSLNLGSTNHGENTGHGQVLGTPAYMSPEQAAGKTRQVDERSDVYGLGAILYEILTGQAPFRGADPFEILEMVIAKAPAAPRSLVAGTPRALEAICLKALAKQPVERYASAGELARDVQRYLADEPVTAYREPLTTRLARWRRRHRALVTGATALLLTSVAALAVGLVLIGRKEREAVVARERAETSYHLAREGLEQCVKKVAEDPRLKQGEMEDLRRVVLEAEVLFYQKFLELQGEEPAFQVERGEAFGNLASVFRELGDLAKAADYDDKAVAIFADLAARQPAVPGHRHNLAKAYHNRAINRGQLGRYPEMEDDFQHCGELARQLVSAHPQDPAFRDLLGNLGLHFGTFQFKAGHVEKAQATLQEASDLYRDLLQTKPEESVYRSQLQTILGNLGSVLNARGLNEEAERTLLEARDLGRRLVDQHPNDPKYLLRLANTSNNLAMVYNATSRTDAAIQALQDGVGVYQQLVKSHPAIAAYTVDFGRIQGNLGSLLWKSRRNDEALDYFTRAIAALDPILAKQPDYRDVRLSLCLFSQYRAHLLTQKGKIPDAARDWDRAFDLADEKTQVAIRPLRAIALAATGDHVRASAEAEVLAKIQPANTDNTYNIACIYGRCAAAVRDDDRLAEKYASRAVQSLRAAVTQGYKDLANLEADKDLDALRQRSDFQQVLTDLKLRQKNQGK